MMSTRKPSSAANRKLKLRDAATYLGVSIPVMTRLVGSGVLPYALDPLDMRCKLVLVRDLDRLKEQQLSSGKKVKPTPP
jgi:hypothetical protein